MQFLINVALASQILLFFSPTTESLLSPLPLPLLDPSFLLSSSSELTAGIPIGDILQTSLQKAVKSGTAGATAAVFQVSSLMWLRTTLNYQYKYDLTTLEAMAELNKQGGFSRFYQGLGFAILQSPLSRFGDTAANSFILSLVDAYDPLFPGFLRTLLASIAAGGFRILLMPIDTCKTCLQVNGEKGFQVLGAKIEANGPRVLFAGSIATCLATVVGHYPWFLVYNSLSTWLPSAADVHTSLTSAADISGSHPQAYDPVLRLLESVDERFLDLARSAFIGLCASCTSDICSNSLRVLKTYRQSSDNEISYQESIAKIVSEKGWASLFGRGLKTRLLSNALQGMVFSVLFKYFQSR